MRLSPLKLGSWTLLTASLALWVLGRFQPVSAEGPVLAVLLGGAILLESRAIRPGDYGYLSCLGAVSLACLGWPALGAMPALVLALLALGVRLFQARVWQEGLRDLLVELAPLVAAAAVCTVWGREDLPQRLFLVAASYLATAEVSLRQFFPVDLEAQLVRRRFILANIVGAVLLSYLLAMQPLAALFVFPLLLIVQHGTYGVAMQFRKGELHELADRLKEVRRELSGSKRESRQKSTRIENKQRDQQLLEELSRFFSRNPGAEEILDGARDAIARLVPNDVLILFSHQQESQRFAPVVWSTKSDELVGRVGPEGLSDPVLAEAMAHQVLRSVGRAEVGRSRLVRETGTGLIVPIPDFGLAYLGRQEGIQLSERRRELLLTLATQVSLGLRSAGYRIRLQRSLEELTEAHEELKASQAQLVQASKMAAVGQLAAGVAHELNTPLAAILLQVQAGKMRLESGKLDRLPRAFEIAEESAMAAQAIISKLLKFSHRSEAHRETVDVEELLHKTVALLKEPFLQDGVEVQVRGGQGLKVCGDPVELQQVLTNLLLNARDAALGNVEQRSALISVRAAQFGGRMTITVEDSGQGFTPEVQERMFEPFFTTKLVGEGTGLGLSVSHQIVAEHGGELVAENGPNGAVFTLRLDAVGDQAVQG